MGTERPQGRAKRRERVLRNRKDRLAYITGEVKELPKDPKQPKSPTRDPSEEKGAAATSHCCSKADEPVAFRRGGGFDGNDEPSTTGTAFAEVGRAPRGGALAGPALGLKDGPLPAFRLSAPTALVRIARMALPCALAMACYAHNALETDPRPSKPTRNAGAWFLTYQVVALSVLGVEKPPPPKATVLAQMALAKVLETLRWHFFSQILDDLAFFLLSLFCLSFLLGNEM